MKPQENVEAPAADEKPAEKVEKASGEEQVSTASGSAAEATERIEV